MVDPAVSGEYFKDSVWVGVFLTGTAGVWVYLVLLLRRAVRAGEVLLEIGRPRAGLVVGLLTGGGSLLCGIAWVTAMAGNPGDRTALIRQGAAGLFFFSLAIYMLFFWLSKWSVCAIRERGIAINDRLLAWEAIETCYWAHDQPDILVFRLKRRFPWGRVVNVPVPPRKQAATVEILGRKLPLTLQ
jgi:hypothetical protein